VTCLRSYLASPTARSPDDYVVEIVNGKRLFTAPAHINPGNCLGGLGDR